MRCPYQKQIIEKNEYDKKGRKIFSETRVYFNRCDKYVCPYYSAITDRCMKVEQEIMH